MTISAKDERRIIAIAADSWGLSPIEKRVLASWARTEDSVDQIADMLGNSPHTIRAHLKHIYQKAGVHSRGELIRMVFRIGASPSAEAKRLEPPD